MQSKGFPHNALEIDGARLHETADLDLVAAVPTLRISVGSGERQIMRICVLAEN